VRRTEALDEVFAEAPAADRSTDPEVVVARRELQQRVWRALLRLGDAHREVIALRDYLDLSYDEIAATLKIPRGTVMSRLHRARRRLAELLGPAQGGGP
jgi:RNA polymerase sigma-70 factor (ECF subfamily)